MFTKVFLLIRIFNEKCFYLNFNLVIAFNTSFFPLFFQCQYSRKALANSAAAVDFTSKVLFFESPPLMQFKGL